MPEVFDVRLVSDAATLEPILPLIASYQRFYKQEPDDARNRAFFSQIGSSARPGAQLAAFDAAGRPLGFATLYIVPSSLSATSYCLLNDVFTEADCRGRGVARALIRQARLRALALGYGELEWVTHVDNTTAQRLYDGIGATKSAWYIYNLSARE